MFGPDGLGDTTVHSRETTPTPCTDINLAMEELAGSSLVHSTPNKPSKAKTNIPSLIAAGAPTTPHRYNLRTRSRNSSSSRYSTQDWVVGESVDTFTKQVKQASRNSKKMSRKIQVRVRHPVTSIGGTIFSG